MVYLQSSSDPWQVGWWDRGCGFSRDVCCCQSSCLTDPLWHVWSDVSLFQLLNPLHSWPWPDQQSMWNSTAGRNGSFATTYARQEPWQCGKAPAVTLHAPPAPGISIRPDLHSSSLCCGTWVLKIKQIKIQKWKEILYVCLGYIQEYQYFILLCLLSWEILTSKARLNISHFNSLQPAKGAGNKGSWDTLLLAAQAQFLWISQRFLSLAL